MKTCTRCKNPKKEEDFGKEPRTKSGLKAHCKTCHSKINKKEVQAIRSKEWRENNPELREAYNRSVSCKYSQMKRAAKRSRRELGITKAQFAELIQGNKCHYCSGPLSDYGYSIDRLDHLAGYTIDNVAACCGVRKGNRMESCNFRKGHLECIGFVYPRTVELLKELLEKEQ